MKTSTKLTILLFSLILLAMVAYSYLLQQQFEAETFYYKHYPSKNKYIFKQLSEFKNIVIEGDLKISKESTLTSNKPVQPGAAEKPETIVSLDWEAPVQLIYSKNKTGYDVSNGYEDIVKTKISNDTLYISFFKRYAKNAGTPPLNVLKIYSDELVSLKAISGTYKITDFDGDKLSIFAEDSRINAFKINYQELIVHAEKVKSIHIDSSTINTLNYSLKGKSKLQLSNNTIKQFRKEDVDSTSKISVEADALSMDKFLTIINNQ